MGNYRKIMELVLQGRSYDEIVEMKRARSMSRQTTSSPFGCRLKLGCDSAENMGEPYRQPSKCSDEGIARETH